MTLRFAIDKPATPAGTVSLADELPAASDEHVRVGFESVTVDQPTIQSWMGEWSLELTAQRDGITQVRHMMLRKACVILSSRPDLTVLGAASESNAARLTEAWHSVITTLREQAP